MKEWHDGWITCRQMERAKTDRRDLPIQTDVTLVGWGSREFVVLPEPWSDWLFAIGRLMCWCADVLCADVLMRLRECAKICS